MATKLPADHSIFYKFLFAVLKKNERSRYFYRQGHLKAVVRRFSIQKKLLKILRNSQENSL